MKTKILIIGASGMIGHTLFTELSNNKKFKVLGTVRESEKVRKLVDKYPLSLVSGIDVEGGKEVEKIIASFNPSIIINAVGIVKQRPEAGKIETCVKLNSLWPHRLARYAQDCGAKVIQVSSDCVFSGIKGNYKESDVPDPIDAYGQTKLLGELHYDGTLTIRTSTIGHEIGTKNGLIEWFLSQKNEVEGYMNAVYSGLPTVELARIIGRYVIPNINKMHGIYQVSTSPINKYELLKLVARVYGKDVKIKRRELPRINRSLNPAKLMNQTGYKPLPWELLLRNMYNHYCQSGWYKK